VTHRLAGVTAVYEILVLQDGRVTQRGTRGQLLAEPGWYQQRWRERWLAHATPLERQDWRRWGSQPA
jgi:ABC-type protease/lipase transport system fused ATPase/permease subunit